MPSRNPEDFPRPRVTLRVHRAWWMKPLVWIGLTKESRTCFGRNLTRDELSAFERRYESVGPIPGQSQESIEANYEAASWLLEQLGLPAEEIERQFPEYPYFEMCTELLRDQYAIHGRGPIISLWRDKLMERYEDEEG